MNDKPEAVAQWQRRRKYSRPLDPPGMIPQWENCSAKEATGHFERTPGYEYRPLYAHPPSQDASALVDVLKAIRELCPEVTGDMSSASLAGLLFNIETRCDAALTAWEAQHG